MLLVLLLVSPKTRKDDLIKKGVQSFIAPMPTQKLSENFTPVQNGLTPSIVFHTFSRGDHHTHDDDCCWSFDGKALQLVLQKEGGLVRGDPNHRNIIQHLYRNFQGEGHLLENKTGDKLPEAWRKNGGTKHTCGQRPLNSKKSTVGGYRKRV